jgi:hypothetical protein
MLPSICYGTELRKIPGRIRETVESLNNPFAFDRLVTENQKLRLIDFEPEGATCPLAR